MYTVDDEQFDSLIAQAMDRLPHKYMSRLKNVAIVVADELNQEQRSRLHLLHGQTLYGLYEGIPLTKRGSNYNLVLPDKITLFKRPMEQSSLSLEQLAEQVRHTLWHEIAHYFGLGHEQIYRLDGTK